MAAGTLLVIVSLLMPWFEGSVSESSAGFAGYDFGLAIFFCLVVAACGTAGSWAAHRERNAGLVVLALLAGLASVLLSGFALALSSTMGRIVSVANASSVVDATARGGVFVLFFGSLLLSVGALVHVIGRGASASRELAESIRDGRSQPSASATGAVSGDPSGHSDDWIT